MSINKKVVHSVFDDLASKIPNQIAIKEKEQEIDYSGLRKYSNKIANFFLKCNLKQGQIVGLFLESGIDYVSSILGINKAGGIFLPLDKHYPIHRLEYMLKEIAPQSLITNEQNKQYLFTLLKNEELNGLVKEVIVVKGENDDIDLYEFAKNQFLKKSKIRFSEIEVDLQINGEDGMYLLYTSGSTGHPKAIQGKHSGLSHFIHWEINEFGLGSNTKVSQLAPLLFDVSLRDIFVALLTGGVLYIPDSDIKTDPQKLLKWIERNKISLIHIVPSIFRLLIKEVQNDQALLQCIQSLEKILLAGEPLYGQDVISWRQLSTTSELVNLYGPSETTLAKIFNRINHPIHDPTAIIPLGKPISNTIIILIKNNSLCEIGEIGEIHIKTPFRSKGYYKNDELNKQLFIQNPLHNDFEDIIYKTGDLGKYLSDRSIEYVGRQDSQVKIRGNRVELLEVEKVILKFEGVEQAVVKAVQSGEGELLLACYYIEKSSVDLKKMRFFIGNYLPDYMHPSYFINLQEFPLNLNGKIDKRALPRPEDLLYGKTLFEPPKNEYERRLCVIWSEVLGLKKIGVKSSFFELGGHSLRATKVITRIYREFEKEISLKFFFQNPTVEKISLLLASMDAASYKQIEALPPQVYYEISHAQKRLWVLDQIEKDQIAYNVLSAYILNGNIDEKYFSAAFAGLINRHEILRTSFVIVNGLPRQKVNLLEDVHSNIEFLDLTEEEDPLFKIQQIAKAEEKLPFNLETGPLIRIKVVKINTSQSVVLLTMHHIVCDAWSLSVLRKDFFALYNQSVTGKNSLQPLRIQYKDFSKWQNDLLHDTKNNIHKHYWLSKFNDSPHPINLSTDFARSPVKTYSGDRARQMLSLDILTKAQTIASNADASLFMFLIAALKTLLFKYSGDVDITIGSPTAGRNHLDLEDQIGYYVNTLALRTVFDSHWSFNRLLSEVKQMVLDAYEHQNFPFDQLVEDLQIARDMARSPLFDIMLVLHESSMVIAEDAKMENVSISDLDLNSEISKFDLTFSFFTTPIGLALTVEYNTGLFTKERIEKMLAHFKQLFCNIVEQSELPIYQLDYLLESEKSKLINIKNSTDRYINDTTIIQAFELQVSNNPFAIAVSFDDKELTYSELNKKSNQLARYLINNYEVKRGDFIGVLTDRSEEVIVILLAVLKTGAAYVALDPTYPTERLNFIIADTNVKVIISNTFKQQIGIAANFPILDIENSKTEINALPSNNLEIATQPEDLAYVIYTSGSTGVPKGVMVEHKNVIQLFFNDLFPFEFNDKDTWTLFHSISFDFSVWEILGALFFGGKLIVVRKEVAHNPEEFVELLFKNKVTVLNQIPTVFNKLIPAILKSDCILAMRYIIFGGEALNPTFLDGFHEKYPDIKLINMYGITETTIHSTLKEIGYNDIKNGLSNIGKALPTAHIYILDNNLAPVADNVIGEIAVGGAGIARGYLNQDKLTADKFISNPFNGEGRLYISGDLGLRLPNGDIIYMGRKDKQIKLNGFRIEAGEIESALILSGLIKDVIVVIKETKDNIKHLVAYVLADFDISSKQLREFLTQKIPQYMIPSHFIILEDFPLTNSGKVDKQQLPDPTEFNAEEFNFNVLPSNAIEELLYKVFVKVLGRPKLSITDNFFSLGGDSIKAIQIAYNLHNEGYKITVRDIFRYPEIVNLAKQVQLIKTASDQSLITGQIHLTPIQRRFFNTRRYSYNHNNQAVMLYSELGFDYDATKSVFYKIQEHHDILRSNFQSVAGEIHQIGQDLSHSLSLEFFDFRESNITTTAFREICDDIQASIDIQNGPLMKLALFKLPDADRILIVVHHLVIDGVSWRILFEDIGVLFQQYNSGLALSLQQKTDSYKLWSEKLLSYAASEAFIEEKNYWRNLIQQEYDRLERLKFDKENIVKDSSISWFTLSRYDTELLLSKVNQAFNTEINDILLSALGLSLYKVFNVKKNLIAMEGHGREEIISDINISRTVGWFTSIYPVRIDITEKDDLAVLIKEIKETLRLVPNKGIGYGIFQYLTVDANKEKYADPQISFNYLGQFDADEANTNSQVSDDYKGKNKNDNEFREYDIEISGIVGNGKLEITIEYNPYMYRKEDIDKLSEEYKKSLSDIIHFCSSVETPSLTPSDISYKGLTINDLETFFD